MEHLLPHARGCRVSWAMMAEVARGGDGGRGAGLLSASPAQASLACPVSRIVSVDVCSEGGGVCFACKDLPITGFSQNVWDLALNTEMHICRTKYDSGYHQLSYKCSRC